MPKPKQPKIKKGTTFTGWATFNWGMCHQRVYRTRREAQANCIDIGRAGSSTWNDVKDHYQVVKVKCIVQ